MTLLTKVTEIRSNDSDDIDVEIFVCVPCQETHNHTIAPDAETVEGDCEWAGHE